MRLKRKQRQALFRILRRDKKGRVDYLQFLRLCDPQNVMSGSPAVEVLRAALHKACLTTLGSLDMFTLFQRFDKRGFGRIPFSDFCKLSQRLAKIVLSDTEKAEVQASIQLDRKNAISYHAFSQFISASNGMTWSKASRAITPATCAPGSVGEYLEAAASKRERKNYVVFMKMLSTFNKYTGLNPRRMNNAIEGDSSITLQLGAVLKASVHFHTK